MANWHRRYSARNDYRNRRFKAHLIDYSRYGLYAKCGRHMPRVTVDLSNAGNPDNNVCKKCLAKLGLKIERSETNGN